MKAVVKVKSGSLGGESTIWTSTGQMYELYTKLKSANRTLKDDVEFSNYHDDNLTFRLVYDCLGHVIVKGTFYESSNHDNILRFEFITDQTFISKTITELSFIASKYGDEQGLFG